MKKDLYRFAKARRDGERIILIEDEWYKKLNQAISKRKFELSNFKYNDKFKP